MTSFEDQNITISYWLEPNCQCIEKRIKITTKGDLVLWSINEMAIELRTQVRVTKSSQDGPDIWRKFVLMIDSEI